MSIVFCKLPGQQPGALDEGHGVQIVVTKRALLGSERGPLLLVVMVRVGASLRSPNGDARQL